MSISEVFSCFTNYKYGLNTPKAVCQFQMYVLQMWGGNFAMQMETIASREISTEKVEMS